MTISFSGFFVAAAQAAEGVSRTAPSGWEEMLGTKVGQYALITFFFALIIMYLRVLFGPKGFFREKKWDEWNEEARKREEAE